MNKAKQFAISRAVVEAAFERVKANKGAAGVDNESIADFEKDRERNLYKLWNRMSAGSYFPPAVKSVEIPKRVAGNRILGVPTVSDRVAQMVAKLYLEPEVEPIFHPDSYGYRPNRSALDAVAKTRERCFKKAWVIDLDIRAFFDSLSHDLVLQMVRKHSDCKWILLYIERWLKAPLMLEDGTLVERNVGSPQGSVISPLLSNIAMHHVFDRWMTERYPNTPFERYADDVVAHCETEAHAKAVLKAITKRLAEHQLEVNLEKTRIVYCKNANRPGEYETERFDFLGYTFKARSSKNSEGEMFLGFNPAIADGAQKDISGAIRQWRLHMRSDHSIEELAKQINPEVQGWINYYGRFYKSAMVPILKRINWYLVKWAMRKYKTLHRKPRVAREWLARLHSEQPKLFAHWRFGVAPYSPSAGVIGAV
jgi:RNA-directed DNA polymerase